MKRGNKILIIADAWGTLALGMIGPIYAIFVERIGGDILDASWAYFAFMMSSGIVLYLMGKLEDRSRHKETFVVAGYSLIAAGCLSYIFVYNQLTLVVTQIILGLGGAVLTPAFDSLYSDFLDRNKEASEWADWEGMGLMVTAAASLIGGYIASMFGFKTLFLVMFLSALVGVITSLNLFRKKKYLASS